MKGDISADFHVAEKRFTGVRAQAGRVLTDADFNAAFDVLDATLEELVRTLLCAAGSPDSGLSVLSATPATLVAPDGTTVDTYAVVTAPGTFVLGGRALRVREPIDSLVQTDWLSQLLEPDILAGTSLVPDVLPPAPVAGRVDLVWLEQVERPVRAVEDREIQERALGSADTTTRLRPQLRIRVLEDVPAECNLAGETLAQTLIAGGHALSDDHTEVLSAARLGLAFVADGPGLDPCAPAGAAGYLGAENQTLKVMLTATDRFVWAYDHGEPLYRVLVDAAAGQIEFLTEPRDPLLYPLPDQTIEILPWDVLLSNAEKAAAPVGHFARLTGHYDPPTRRIDYDGSMPAAWQTWLNGLPNAWLGRDDDPPRFFYARIWQPPTAGPGPDQPTGTGIVLPETGIALHFGGNGLTGDYWTAALRPNAPETIQPWNLMIDPAAGETPHEAPRGPRRFFAPLGLVTWGVAGTEPTIEDCRNRFRRLCRIKSCCSYQVGDGNQSFGDFNSIQEAVDALPLDAGGEICLLPGIHDGPVDLRDRQNITISGCGYRSQVVIVADPAQPNRPGFWLDGASGIRFVEFAVTGSGGPVFGAGSRCSHVELRSLRILAQQTAAIALVFGLQVDIADCRIEAEEPPQALTPEEAAGLLPLVFVAGQGLRIERNHIVALPLLRRSRNRLALGGIQIGGSSRDVRIEDNHIEGGNGHGITLGSLRSRRIRDDDGGIVIFNPPWIVIGEDGCPSLEPGGTIVVPGQEGETVLHSAGPIEDLRIRDNDILDHGACGISVAHWFVGGKEVAFDDLDAIEIDEVEIDDNRIYRCMQLDLVSALPIDVAFNSGYGGIALDSATDLAIEDNVIRDCGRGRSPICGIYVRYGERLRIRDNRISDNGRPASLTDPLWVGNIGGIVLSHVDGVEEGLGTQVREVPAALIQGNTVVSPEGRALELVGSGQMMVQGNSLTAHGNNIGGVLLALLFGLLQNDGEIGDGLASPQLEGQYRAAISQIGGSAVLIVNTGINRNLPLLAMSASALSDSGKYEQVPEGMAADDDAPAPAVQIQLQQSDALVGKGLANLEINRTLPRGPVSFSDNMVTFDAFSDAITLSLSSIAIVSLDDVGMHDNHSAIDLVADFVLANALVLGLASCRVVGNRFREILPNPRASRFTIPTTLFSAITFGLLNATELNQGTYCFLAIGFKKPRVLIHLDANQQPTAILDTNRHMLADKYCARYLALSSATGTD